MVTKKQLDKMSKLMERGVPVIKIASEVGCSYATARKYCAMQSSKKAEERKPVVIPVNAVEKEEAVQKETAVAEEVLVVEDDNQEEEAMAVPEETVPKYEQSENAPEAQKLLTLKQYIKTFIGKKLTYHVDMNGIVNIQDDTGAHISIGKEELQQVISELEEVRDVSFA